MAGLIRWISSMKSTSRACRLREHRREIAGLLDHRARRRPDRHAELVRDDVRQRRLAEPGRPVEQHVVERLAALPRRRDRHLQVLADAILADVLVERPRAQPGSRTGRRRRRGAALTRRSSGHRRGLHHPAQDVAAARCFERRVRRCFLSTSSTAFSAAGALIAEVRPAPTADRRAAARRASPPSGAGSAACSRRGSRSFSSRPMRSAVFLPTPGMRVSRATSCGADRAHQLAGLDPRQHGQRELRADAADRDQPLEQILLERVANP